MNLIFRVAFLLSLILSFQSSAQWTPAGTIFGGQITCLGKHGTNIFAGVGDGKGIYISTNSGLTWEKRFPNAYMRSFASDSNYIYAGLIHNLAEDIYRSSNEGVNWEKCAHIGENIYDLAVKGDTLFAAKYGAIFASGDHGNTWSLRMTGIKGRDIRAITVIDDHLFAGSDSGVYHSTNNGLNWNPVNNGLIQFDVDCLAVSGNILYAGTWEGVYRSTNFGNSWAGMGNGLNGLSIVSLAADGPIVLAGTWHGGPYLSTNNGESWSHASNGFIGVSAEKVFILNGFLFAGTNSGVSRSPIYNVNWSSFGPEKSTIYRLAANQDYIYAGTLYNGVFCSSDNGLTWKNTGLFEWKVTSLATDGNKIYAGRLDNSGGTGGVFMSTDNSPNWINLGMNNKNVYDIFINQNSLFIGTGSEVYKSTNNGVNWINLGSGLYGPVYAIRATDSYLIAGTSFGIIKSTNMGLNWFSTNYGNDVFTVIIIEGKIFAGTYRNGAIVSTDDGNSWTRVTSGLLSDTVYCFVSKDNNLFAGTGQGVFLSTDGGLSWGNVNEGLTDKIVNTLVIKDNYIYAGTGNPYSISGGGVFYRSLSELVAVKEETQLPSAFSLEQNYPNPFNPSTKIKYTLPVSGEVSIKVFDMLGREVQMVYKGYAQAGIHEAEFNASGLSSGVYLYKLTAGCMSISRKMVLVK